MFVEIVRDLDLVPVGSAHHLDSPLGLGWEELDGRCDWPGVATQER